MTGVTTPALPTNAQAGSTYAASQTIAQQFGASMSIPELMMSIQMERANTLDSQIQGQMKDMQKRNEWLRDANAALNAMRNARPTEEDADAVSYGTFTNSKGEDVNVHDFMKGNGIDIEEKGADKIGTQVEFDAAIQNLKTSIDTINSTSQMDMIRLQSLMDKRNQTMDLLSNTLSKTGKSLDTIVGNMR